MKIIKWICNIFLKRKPDVLKTTTSKLAMDNIVIDGYFYHVVDDLGNNYKCPRCKSENFDFLLRLGVWTYMSCADCHQRCLLGEGGIQARPQQFAKKAIS